MAYRARIKWSGLGHEVQKWAKDRSVAKGTLFPAPFPVADKPNGKKGRPVIYDTAKLKKLKQLNGNNEQVFRFMTRIGGWLFNAVDNKHLIGFVKGLLPKWMGKIADSYVPYPLPKGKKARATKIYCESNEVTVDQEKGQWVHIKAGTAQLVQVGIGTGKRYPSNVYWPVPAGWVEKKYLERI